MLHGIKRDSAVQTDFAARGGVTRIVIRYTDGREVVVVPDAARETFSEDDVKELKKIFDRAAADQEWIEVSNRATM